MRETEQGFRRFDLTKTRLAAIKGTVADEIVRQRAERTPTLVAARSSVAAPSFASETPPDRKAAPIRRRALSILPPPTSNAVHALRIRRRRSATTVSLPLLRLRAAARRYAWQVANDAAREARERGWEYAA
jgi:hypothetical protein